MRVVFWQNMLSIQQAAHIRALARLEDFDVTWVAQEEVGDHRRSMGWPVPDAAPARVIVGPSAGQIGELLAYAPEKTIHVFSGIRAYPMVARAFRRAVKTSARLVLLQEASDGRGGLGMARRIRCRIEALRLRRRLYLFLAIGDLGMEWYAGCGYCRERLLEFIYVADTPKPGSSNALASHAGGRMELSVVGQCIRRKGVATAIEGLASLRSYPWRLRIWGTGPDEPRLGRLVSSRGLADRVLFMGARPHAEVMAELAASDLLLLPSVFDAWGVVVNEALARGVPVVCSSNCGASILVADSWRGAVFAADSASSFARAVQPFFEVGPTPPGVRERIRRWSERISGESVADYLANVLRAEPGMWHSIPCPWRERNASGKK